MRSWRWTIVDLMVLTAVVAIAFATYRAFWDTTKANHYFALSVNLSLLAVASATAIWGRTFAQRIAVGYAAFAWLYLVFVLKGAFGVTTLNEAVILAERSWMGIPFGAMCGLICLLFVRPMGNPSKQD